MTTRRPAERRTDRWRDRGSAAVEVALIAPVFMTLLMVVIYAGRLSQAENEVQLAASAAARAASQVSMGRAEARAGAVAQDNLDNAEITCSSSQVSVDVSNFEPGGSVSVEVSCTTPMDDLIFLSLPGSGTRTLTATSTEVVDTFRGGT